MAEYMMEDKMLIGKFKLYFKFHQGGGDTENDLFGQEIGAAVSESRGNILSLECIDWQDIWILNMLFLQLKLYCATNLHR